MIDLSFRFDSLMGSLFNGLINELMVIDKQVIGSSLSLDDLLNSDGLSNQGLVNQLIDLSFKEFHDSSVYDSLINSFREVFISGLNDLLGEVRGYYPYLPSLIDWRGESVRREFHPAWLTNERLVNSIDLLLKTNDLLLLNDLGGKLINYFIKVLSIVEEWNYCDYDGCNNFKDFKYDDGRVFCGKCGVELMSVFLNQEIRAYGKDEVNKRRITEVRRRPFGPRTICYGLTDFSGVSLGSVGNKFRRLSKIHNNPVDAYERKLTKSFYKFNKLNDLFDNKDYLYATALRIYSTLVRKQLRFGRGVDAFIAASYYASLKINKEPVFLFDLVDKFSGINDELTQGDVITAYQLIKNNGVLSELGYKLKPISLLDYANHYFDRLNVFGGLRDRMINLISGLGDKGLIGKSPAGLIAAVMYKVVRGSDCPEVEVLKDNLVSQVPKYQGVTKITQLLLADYFHVTDVTIRNLVKKLG